MATQLEKSNESLHETEGLFHSLRELTKTDIIRIEHS